MPNTERQLNNGKPHDMEMNETKECREEQKKILFNYNNGHWNVAMPSKAQANDNNDDKICDSINT